MFTTPEQQTYFLKDYPNFDDITLKRKNSKNPRKYSFWTADSVLNSKTLIFNNRNYHYICLDCDNGISKLHPAIFKFLKKHKIVYFITTGSWSENKPTDSATLCIEFKNYNNAIFTKLNKLFIVVSRLANGEMSCDPLSIGYMMKSVFTNQMKSKYFNLNSGNVFELEELNEIAYSHFNKNWDEVELLANQYRSESFYKKYNELILNDFEDICVNKLENYYSNMKKHNYNNWLYDPEIIEPQHNLILQKYKLQPFEEKIKKVSKNTLIRDYILINWCKCDGYVEKLKFYIDLLQEKFNISKKMIYSIAESAGIKAINTSHQYLEFVSIINDDEHEIAIKNKLNYCRTKKREHDPTKPRKIYKNKGKITYCTIEKNGRMKEIKLSDKSAYFKNGWIKI